MPTYSNTAWFCLMFVANSYFMNTIEMHLGSKMHPVGRKQRSSLHTLLKNGQIALHKQDLMQTKLYNNNAQSMAIKILMLFFRKKSHLYFVYNSTKTGQILGQVKVIYIIAITRLPLNLLEYSSKYYAGVILALALYPGQSSTIKSSKGALDGPMSLNWDSRLVKCSLTFTTVLFLIQVTFPNTVV